jgi:hypothetical protein
MDQKEWPSALIKLYQDYIKEENHGQKNSTNKTKAKDETA